jgi:hypothetical protein
LSESGRKQVATTIDELRDDEIDTLLALLTKHAQRDPKDSEVYQAFLRLVELRPKIMPLFSALIRQLPADELPGPLSNRLTLLSRHHPALTSQVDDLNEYLKTQTGKAAKAAQLRSST